MNFEIRDEVSAGTQSEGTNGSQAMPDRGAKQALAAKRADDAGEKLAAEMKVFQGVAEELKAKRDGSASFEARCRQVLQEATELFGVAPTWTAFYRETVGVEGAVRELFGSPEERLAFEESDSHDKVLEMLTVLRSRDLPDCDPQEPQRMITVRIPKSLHDTICKEANELEVSVNKLCITRMLQQVDRTLIPSSNQKRRGRRPGADYARSTNGDASPSDARIASSDSAT